MKLKINSSDMHFEGVLTLLSKRLNKLGTITTKEAHKICRKKFPYSLTASNFKIIMNLMIELNKAEKIRPGKYNILKPNEPTKTNR